ncbi:MAG: tetratricopeptide repeat protein [Rudaea sp.]
MEGFSLDVTLVDVGVSAGLLTIWFSSADVLAVLFASPAQTAAVVIFDRAAGSGTSRGVSARTHLGYALQLRGDYADSDDVYRRALATSLAHGPTTSYSACSLRQKLATNLRLEHHPREAIGQLEALTTDACFSTLDDSDQWRPTVLATLSEAQLDSGDAAGALANAQSALTFARKAFPERHFRLGISLFAVARAQLAAGNLDAADGALREALAVRSPPHPAGDPRVLEVRVEQARVLQRRGKRDEASKLTDEIRPLLAASNSPYARDLSVRLDNPTLP